MGVRETVVDIRKNKSQKDTMKHKVGGIVIGAGLFLCLLCGIYYVAIDQLVSFGDSKLEALIRAEIGKFEGPVFRFSLRHITSLDASGLEIKELEGIENLRNLRELNLEDNFVKDVSPLAKLNHLTTLSLRNNAIIDLDAVYFYEITDLPLRSLSLRHNVIRPDDAPQQRLADIRLLRHFDNLEVLELRDNHISDIYPLQELQNLIVLDISQNPLQAGCIEALSALEQLRELNLRETGLRNLRPIAQFRHLEYLNVHSNDELASIMVISNFRKLHTLIARNVPIGEEIIYVSNLIKLQRLNIRNCLVRDLSVLAELMKQGALQDDHARGIKADIDIRENPVPRVADDGIDGYGPLRPFWDNIRVRAPQNLP